MWMVRLGLGSIPIPILFIILHAHVLTWLIRTDAARTDFLFVFVLFLKKHHGSALIFP